MRAGSEHETRLPRHAAGGPISFVKPICFNGIMILGEAPGRDEIIEGRPFVGRAGRFLDGLLTRAGIERSDCLVANTFRYRPDGNKISLFFASRRAAMSGGLDLEEALSPLNGRFCLREYASDVRALTEIVEAHRPRVVVALGATATWAATGDGRLGERIGLPCSNTCWPCVVLPSWHPAYLMRRRDTALDDAVVSHLAAARSIASEGCLDLR